MKNQIFETIKPGTRRGRWARPQVTMNARGQMKINHIAFEMLGEPELVRVLFDPVTQTIALAAPKDAAEEAISHECHSHSVHGRHGGRLIKVYGIHDKIEGELYTCIRFKDIRLDHEGRLILELSKSVPAFNGTRIGKFQEWQERQQKQHREENNRNYSRRRDAAGKRTWEEWRSDQAAASIERDRRLDATKQRKRAERDLERNERKLAKDRLSRATRDYLHQELVDDLKRRKEELENERQHLLGTRTSASDGGVDRPASGHRP